MRVSLQTQKINNYSAKNNCVKTVLTKNAVDTVSFTSRKSVAIDLVADLLGGIKKANPSDLNIKAKGSNDLSVSASGITYSFREEVVKKFKLFGKNTESVVYSVIKGEGEKAQRQSLTKEVFESTIESVRDAALPKILQKHGFKVKTKLEDRKIAPTYMDLVDYTLEDVLLSVSHGVANNKINAVSLNYATLPSLFELPNHNWLYVDQSGTYMSFQNKGRYESDSFFLKNEYDQEKAKTFLTLAYVINNTNGLYNKARSLQDGVKAAEIALKNAQNNLQGFKNEFPAKIDYQERAKEEIMQELHKRV